MSNESLLILSTDEEKNQFQQLKNNSPFLAEKETQAKDLILFFQSFITDTYLAFYLEKPEMKKIEELSPDLWMNYYLVGFLLEHYHYKNIHSLTEKNHQNSFWLIEIFTKEFVRIITEKKKIAEKTKTLTKFLSDLKNQGINFSKIIQKPSPNITKEEKLKNKQISSNLLLLKSEMRTFITKTMAEVNKALTKFQPLILLGKGHNIVPFQLIQISYNDRLALAEKIINRKAKEIIRLYSQLDLENKIKYKETYESTWEERVEQDSPQEIFYLTDITSEKKDKYKKWLLHELEKYNPKEKYNTLTVYIKAGHPESRTEELETFALALGIIEISRLEKRNLIIILSGLKSGEKTFIFTPDIITINEFNKNTELSTIDGIIMLINDLLSGEIPPKPKISLNLKLDLKLKPNTPSKKK